MILPKITAALLSMCFFGTAYACIDARDDTSLDQWIVICGATNGAAAAFRAPQDDLHRHRRTIQSHVSRYAAEKQLLAADFEPLFERGLEEGRRVVAERSKLFGPRQSSLLEGFRRDTHISYADLMRVLDARSHPADRNGV